MNGIKNRQFAQALLPWFYEWVGTSAAALAEYLQADFFVYCIAICSVLIDQLKKRWFLMPECNNLPIKEMGTVHFAD